MGWGFGNVGGSAGVGVKIVNGLYEPSNPQEGTVWVETSTAVSGYSFSVDEPIQPVEGMIWVQTGAKSAGAFNADKRNTLMVYPVRAEQYSSGVWSPVSGKTYVGGRWKSWGSNVYLYNNGEDHPEKYGGWVVSKTQSNSNPSLSKQRDYILITTSFVSGVQFGGGKFSTKNAIATSGYDSLTVIYDLDFSGNVVSAGDIVFNGKKQKMNIGGTNLKVDFDISSATSPSKLEIVLDDNAVVEMKVKEIYYTIF